MVEASSESPNIVKDFSLGRARECSLAIARSDSEIFRQGAVTLSAGGESNWYFDARRLNLIPEGGYWTSLALINLIGNTFPETQAVGGSGVDGRLVVSTIVPLSAVLYREKLISRPFSGFFVTDDGQIEGYCGKTNNLVVEGTTTTGASTILTIRWLVAQGKGVDGAIAILDRGGGQAIRRAGFHFVSLFTPVDLGIF